MGWLGLCFYGQGIPCCHSFSPVTLTCAKSWWILFVLLSTNRRISSASPVVQCIVERAPICSNVHGGWFMPHPCHSVRMTYRPSAALRLIRGLRISHNKFLRANKWTLILTFTCQRNSVSVVLQLHVIGNVCCQSYFSKERLQGCCVKCSRYLQWQLRP